MTAVDRLYQVRRAVVGDIPAIARHRAAMFIEMGSLPADQREAMELATVRYLTTALPAGEYEGWIAERAGDPLEGDLLAGDAGSVIGGAGLQHRRILPRPIPTADGVQVMDGREAIVINVYTEAVWRRRGVAMALMTALMAHVRTTPVQRLVLHASTDGRPLYEALGFESTNEMRLVERKAPL